MTPPDKVLGTLLGSAVGDALGMPIDGLSHQNVRTYYKGVKAYRDDEYRRDLGAGQWTRHTQRLFALVRALAGGSDNLANRYAEELTGLTLRRPADPATATSDAAVLASALSLAGDDRTSPLDRLADILGDEAGPVALAAAAGQVEAVRLLLAADPGTLDGPAFFHAVTDAAVRAETHLSASTAVSDRLRTLAGHLDAFPLDLQDLCAGTGPAADEAWPFALAMLARNPALLEATMLPGVNVGGAASAIGALLGALLGALHGWSAFPEAWRAGLEDVGRLEAEARACAKSSV
ncbi:MAG: ADP-ribosylglycohydrolase family protein [Bacteroidota bacterium]